MRCSRRFATTRRAGSEASPPSTTRRPAWSSHESTRMAPAADRLRREVVASSRHHGAALNSPEGRAWNAFLRPHASLTRTLDTELRRDADLSLADFDVLIQLGLADRATLRMSELASRTLVSRSGTTRRVEQLERSGLVGRSASESDHRSVSV